MTAATWTAAADTTGPAPGLGRTVAWQPGRSAAGRARWLAPALLALHLAVLWGLARLDVVHRLVHERAPLMVALLSSTAPTPPAPAAAPPARPALPKPPPPALPATPSLTVPSLVPPPSVQPAEAPPAPANPPAAPTAVPTAVPAPALAAPVAPVHTAAPPAPAAPPQPRPVAASALRYAVLPPVELPLASRRLGESGTVLLRVVFDTDGRARQVSVLRSSGFPRLDEQALQAMRQARIVPHLEHGQPIEVVAQAPLVYELD